MTLQPSQASTLFRTTFLSVSLWSNHETSFFCIFLCRISSLTKTTGSNSYLLKKTGSSHCPSLLSTIPSCLLLVKKKAMVFNENFIATPRRVTQRDKILFLCLLFVFFFFFFFLVLDFWLIETTTGYLQGLTHSNPSKSTNQVALSNEHEKHAFWV